MVLVPIESAVLVPLALPHSHGHAADGALAAGACKTQSELPTQSELATCLVPGSPAGLQREGLVLRVTRVTMF